MSFEIQISFNEDLIVLQSGNITKRFSNLIAIDKTTNKIVDIGHTEQEIAAYNPKAWHENKHKVVFEPIFNVQNFDSDKMILATRLFVSIVHNEIRGIVPFERIICHITIPNYVSFDKKARESYEFKLEAWNQLKTLSVNRNIVISKDWLYHFAKHGLDLGPLIVLLAFLSQMDKIRSMLNPYFPLFAEYLLFIALLMFIVFWATRIAWIFGMKFLLPKKVVRRILEQNITPFTKFSISRLLVDLILGKYE
jgi:hypothetical protein